MTTPDETPDEPRDLPPGTLHGSVEHTSVAARVPERIGRGVLATDTVVFERPQEFVIDFVQRLAAPHAVVARVVVSREVFGQFVAALRENMRLYESRIGPVPTAPAMVAEPGPLKIEQVYEDLKLPDDLLSGAYANGVMIGHTPSEFWFDFVTNFYPRAAVSARVFLAASQVPRLMQTLKTALDARK